MELSLVFPFASLTDVAFSLFASLLLLLLPAMAAASQGAGEFASLFLVRVDPPVLSTELARVPPFDGGHLEGPGSALTTKLAREAWFLERLDGWFLLNGGRRAPAERPAGFEEVVVVVMMLVTPFSLCILLSRWIRFSSPGVLRDRVLFLIFGGEATLGRPRLDGW